MTSLRTLFLSLVLFSGLACSGGSNGSFSDSLRFGTGLAGNGFDLAGENTSFSVAALTGGLYFRLESSQDMAGRAVRLYLGLTVKDFPNPQSYGHILLSSFAVTTPGSYTVKSYLVEQVGPDIGKETHVTDAPLTLTQ